MPLPDFSNAPWWALPVFVACVGVVYALVHLGVIQGRKTPPGQRDGSVELAGAIIDNSKADEIVAALHRNTDAVGGLTSMVSKQANAMDRLREETRDTRDAVKDLTVELVRSSGK